jgi:hypothetical protein
VLHPDEVEMVIRRADEAEVDEMWSFVQRTNAQRWLWHAIDHRSGQVLAYVFGRRKEICQPHYDSKDRLYLAAA